MRRRVIAIFPPLPAANPISDLRRRFDPLADLVPPHITLVFPFESDLTTSELRVHLEAAVRGVAPFPLHLAGVTGNEGEYFFLNVKRGNDQLIEPHDRLYTGPLRQHLSVEHAFVTHLTVGRLPDLGSFQEALAAARSVEICVDTMSTTVTAYSVEPSCSRPLELEVPLS